MEGFKFAIGDRVHDQVTGFSGVITGRAEYSHGGVNRYCVSPYCEETPTGGNKWVDPQWLDEGRLAGVGA